MTTENTKKGVAARGFASMTPEQQQAIARKGGLAVSRNKEHMAKIGQKGGTQRGINLNVRKKLKVEEVV